MYKHDENRESRIEMCTYDGEGQSSRSSVSLENACIYHTEYVSVLVQSRPTETAIPIPVGLIFDCGHPFVDVSMHRWITDVSIFMNFKVSNIDDQ